MDSTSQLLTRTSQLLREVQAGRDGATDELFAALYAELRSIAGRQVRGGPPQATLPPTAVVNEVWLRLRRIDGIQVQSRQHFLRIAARAMRAVLVDHARRRLAQKRRGDQRVPLDDALDAWTKDGTVDPIVLDDAVGGLRAKDERLADIVEMRFFAGLTEEECAEALGLSRRQVQHGWRLARAWLQRELERGESRH